MGSDVSQALVNGRRITELEGHAKLRLALARANTARTARGPAHFESRRLRILHSGAGVAQPASR